MVNAATRSRAGTTTEGMMVDDALIAEVNARLYSGVVSDVLDGLGNMHHALAPGIRPLDDSLVLSGRAHSAPRAGLSRAAGKQSLRGEDHAGRRFKRDDVAVMASPVPDRIGPWGELLTTAAKTRSAAGCVTDGLVRDVTPHPRDALPGVFGRHRAARQQGAGIVVAIDVPVQCGGVPIAPGDWIFGDVYSIAIPGDLCEQTVECALEKVVAENTVRAEPAAGESLAKIFARHGIL